MSAHALDEGRTCTVCGVWLDRRGVWWLADCPGVRWYAWERVPAELATRTALAREGLRPADRAAPAGYYVAWRRKGVVLLYDRRLAIPKRAARSERERASRAAGARRLLASRTCTQCGRIVHSAGRLWTPPAPSDDPDRVLRSTLAGGVPHLCEGCAAAWEYRAELRNLYRVARAILRAGGAALDLGASRMAADAPLRVLDTETTGLALYDEPVELCVVDGRTGAVLLDTRLRPTMPISEGAYALHGISMKDLRKAPGLAEVWPRVRELLRGSLVVCYNAELDRRLLAQAAARYGLQRLACRWWCLMEASTVFDAPDDGRWLSLGDICAELGVTRAEFGPAHGARADARAALAVLRALAARADAEIPAPAAVTS
ncbi:MAG TPA: 3'-5' exonuclease [Ktedonobacterales bacterium]|nr:3'-5' exonuclease [Ktedonobacterales bacterium]